MLMVLAVPFLVKRAGAYRRSNLAAASGGSTAIEPDKRLDARLLVLGILFLLATAGSGVFLYGDFLTGGNEVWPVYLFAGLGLVCGLIWSALVARWMSRRLS